MTVSSGDHCQGTWDRRGRGWGRAIAVPGAVIATGTQPVNQERRRHALVAPADRIGTQRYLAKRTV